MLPALGLVLVLLLTPLRAQYHSLLAEVQGWPSDSNSSTTVQELDKRPTCVLINNYCGKIVPGTGMKKECCGDLVCYKNKCRKRTCC